jgi:segregation and condensation protein B
MSVLGKIESILFVASQPLSVKKIAKAVGKQVADVEEAIENLRAKYNRDDSGIHVLLVDGDVQMGTNPAMEDTISGFVKEEIAGELTKAQLETLTVIAYQGPITRPELELVRGVNCAVILRNLMVRGLIVESDETDKLLPVYRLSTEALAHLGVTNVSELENFEELSKHEYVELQLESTN